MQHYADIVHLPLDEAILCLDCGGVSNGVNGHCPVCGDRGVVALAGLLQPSSVPLGVIPRLTLARLAAGLQGLKKGNTRRIPLPLQVRHAAGLEMPLAGGIRRLTLAGGYGRPGVVNTVGDPFTQRGISVWRLLWRAIQKLLSGVLLCFKNSIAALFPRRKRF